MKDDGGLALKVLRYGLYGSLLIPFVFLKDHAVANEAGKVWAFLFLVEVLFPLYLWLLIKGKVSFPKRGAVGLAVLAFLLVSFAAAIFGIDFGGSFWSKPSRLTGLLFLLHVAAYFLMVVSVWRGHVQSVIRFTVIVAASLSVYAFAQTFGAGVDRPTATFGNASFLAQYLVPHVFLAGWLAYGQRASKRKWAWVAVASVILLGLLATKTRAGVAGLLVGFASISALLTLSKEKRFKKTGLVVLFCIGLFFVAYAAADKWAPTHQWLYDQRLSAQYFSETLGPRSIAAESAIAGFLERPLLGWGPEHVEQALDRHYNPELLRFGIDETRWDRSHSVLLDMLVSAGIIGLLAYLFLFAAAVRQMQRQLQEKTIETALVLSPVFALLGNDLFLFETVMSSILLFMLLALYVTLDSKEGRLKPVKYAWLIVVWAVIISLAGFWHDVLRPMKASSRAHIFLASLSSPPQPSVLMGMADQLLEVVGPYTPQYARLAAPALSLPAGMLLTPEYGDVAERLSLAVLDEAERRDNTYELYLGAVKGLISVPDRSAETDARIEKALQRMEALSPRRQETAWFEGRFKAQRGDLAGGEQSFQRAIEYDPEAAMSHAQYAAYVSAFGAEQ